MSVSKSFLAHALDLLAPVDGVNARPMFGGYGLYSSVGNFGLLDDDELFLRTDEETLAKFIDAKCKQWTYPSPKGPMPTTHYRPPDDAMESAEAMMPWAKLALEATGRRLALKQAAEAAKAKRASEKAAKAKLATKLKKPAPKVKKQAAKSKTAASVRAKKKTPKKR